MHVAVFRLHMAQEHMLLSPLVTVEDFPRGSSGKILPASACHKRCRLDSWVGRISCRRKWQPIPVVLPGKSHGQRSLVGYSPLGDKESGRTEVAQHDLAVADQWTRMSWLSGTAALQCEFVSSGGTHEEKEYLLPGSHQTAATPYGEPRRKFRMWTHRVLAPDCWGACERSDFREPRLLHLLVHRKLLNSLTWDIWLSLINNNLLMFRLIAVCCKTSI